jgi:homoserine O-acetyltransferase
MRTLAVVLLLFLPAVARAQQKFAELGDFKLESGEVIRHCRVGYRTFGKLAPDRSNAVLFLTWFTGTSEPLVGFFGRGQMVGPEHYLVAVDALGDGVSSSPSNSRDQPRMKFPRFTIRDMVESQHQLLTRVLGIQHLRAVMGVSMGGLQAFQWSLSHPDFMDKVVSIHGTPRLESYDRMLWQAQNQALTLDPAWNGGDYQKQPSGRLVASISALTDFAPTRFNQENSRADFEANMAKLSRGVESFDANDRIRQTEAILAHDVSAPFGGSLAKAGAAVKAKLMVVVTDSDHIVPPGASLELARAARAEVLQLQNACGHSGANCEFDRVKKLVAAFLAR